MLVPASTGGLELLKWITLRLGQQIISIGERRPFNKHGELEA
jgi:hypothetical protein